MFLGRLELEPVEKYSKAEPIKNETPPQHWLESCLTFYCQIDLAGAACKMQLRLSFVTNQKIASCSSTTRNGGGTGCATANKACHPNINPKYSMGYGKVRIFITPNNCVQDAELRGFWGTSTPRLLAQDFEVSTYLCQDRDRK